MLRRSSDARVGHKGVEFLCELTSVHTYFLWNSRIVGKLLASTAQIHKSI